MRLSYVFCFVFTFSLIACESAPKVNSSATGKGKILGTGGPVTAALISRPIKPQSPGSSEDFVVNVGDRVLFGLDEFQLTKEARSTLEKQVVWLKQYPGISVSIEGHTDERGTREYNLALGERRANSVRDYMIALGVNPNRLRTISFGKERPVDPASSKEGWAKNRRGVTVVGGRNN